MKKILLLTVLLLVGVCTQGATAAVDVDINIGMPPPFDYDEPADVIVVPGTSGYVYMVPEVEGVYFYNGYWYRVYGDRWYRSAYFRGPWNYVRLSLVPRLIIHTPRDYYRYAPSGYYRVPYRDLHRHWMR